MLKITDDYETSEAREAKQVANDILHKIRRMKLKGITQKSPNGSAYVFEAYSYECLGNLCQVEAIEVSLNCFPVCETWSSLFLILCCFSYLYQC